MTAAELTALVTAITALIAALGTFASVVGHLIHHQKADQAQQRGPAAGDRMPPRP